MSENVIILGAGFSYDAGIPLLSNFIERMWEYSIRGIANEKKLTAVDKKTLEDALEIRSEMDGYHGRVAFDDRNIEDILSMLAFNQLGGGKSDKDKLKSFTNAISTTIELSCNVKHSGIPINNRYTKIDDGDEIYRRFWKALFNRYRTEKSLPTIITFNYDLVLERALFQVLINTIYSPYDNRVPFDNIRLDYQYSHFPPQTYKVEYANYGYDSSSSGTILKPYSLPDHLTVEAANVEILKLHGSLNFPIAKPKSDEAMLSLTDVRDNPYVLPPISNKQSNSVGNSSWRIALQRLREAKNVTFVGYSLPKTDTYMQFFLKAALGPNQQLNKLFIFDPLLWRAGSASDDMKKRYEMCFSEQLRSRIIFQPQLNDELINHNAGTTGHFVGVLEKYPERILF